MSTSRQGAAAILLANGQVLVVGGHGFGKSLLGDLFNPATGTFRTTANKGTQASYLTSTMLQNGAVLLTGGAVAAAASSCGLCGPPLVSTSRALLFHSSTASFSTAGSIYSRYFHTATLLVGGEVLVTGVPT